jgi:lipopolysaccharide transport system ATP-binding protein
MAAEITISLQQVSKCFKRYGHPSDRLKEILLPGKSRAEEFWAVRDISLEVHRGETLGIIGQNGSGKSTLLQMIAGTLTPTAGQVQINGRVSALLELGSGFNPEFTGRQNVFFNGRVLGLSQAEVAAKFEEIAAFADIGDFIDQPVKTYSSGMIVRLAFAVATSVEPDILIVDEALAVGDIYFQAKCFKRMRKMIDRGITVLFVSHDLTMVKALCDRCLWMEHGKPIALGAPRDLAEAYQRQAWDQQGLFSSLEEGSLETGSPEEAAETKRLQEFVHLDDLDAVDGDVAEPATPVSPADPPPTVLSVFAERAAQSRTGTGEMRILDFQLCDRHGRPMTAFDYHEPVTACYVIQANIDVPVYDLGMIVKDIKGNEIFSIYDLQRKNLPQLEADQVLKVTVKTQMSLRSGSYYTTLAILGYRNHRRYVGDRVSMENVIFYDYVEMGYFFDVNFFPTRPVHGPVHFDVVFEVGS